MSEKERVDWVGYLPFLPYTLTASKPEHYYYMKERRANLGKHIEKVMKERRLSVKDAAVIMGVTNGAICHWTSGRHLPQYDKVGKIMEFLGYNPFEGGDDHE